MSHHKMFLFRETAFQQGITAVKIIDHLLISVMFRNKSQVTFMGRRHAVAQMITVGDGEAMFRQKREQFHVAFAIVTHSVGELHHGFRLLRRYNQFASDSLSFFLAGKCDGFPFNVHFTTYDHETMFRLSR